MEVKKQYDFIVVGGGTAGLLVAGRLAESPKVKVLVIEAGPDQPEQEEMITTPALAFELPESRYDWAYETTMIDKPRFKRVEPANTRGKVLGGSSCLNYFTWLRGSSATYDEWVEFGGPDWSFDKCIDYFTKPASFHDEDKVLGEDPPYAGANEPSSLLNIAPAAPIPLATHLTQAWTSRGYKVTADILSGHVGGMSHVIRTIYKGKRSTSNCFVKGKTNIDILPNSIAERIIVKNGSAEGVVVKTPRERLYYEATREVIASCGVFESPKLLMLSGIGPQDQLLSYELPCVANSPHVGKNLQDHPVLPHVFRVKDGYSMDHILRPGPEREREWSLYKKSQEGAFSSGLLEMSAFPRIDERLVTCKEWRELRDRMRCDPLGPQGQPHLELDFVPCFAKPFQPHIPVPDTGSYLTVIVSLLRPQSRGTVSLRSNDPADHPAINLNFLAEPVDLIGLREGVRFVDEVLQKGDAAKEVITGEYPEPLPRESDEEMEKTVHQRLSTGYHPCGTCRIGKSIDQGVVDHRLRVHEVKSLRVIDASVFPIIPDARIQNAVYMVAEKGSQAIKEDHPDIWPVQTSKTAKAFEGAYSFLGEVKSMVTQVAEKNREVWRQALG